MEEWPIDKPLSVTVNLSSLHHLSSTLDGVLEFAFGYFKKFNPDDPYVRTPEGQRLMQAANYPKAGKLTGKTRISKSGFRIPVYSKAWEGKRQESFAQAEAENRIPDLATLKAPEREKRIEKERGEKAAETVPGLGAEKSAVKRGALVQQTRGQRIKNFRGVAAMKTAQNRRIIKSWGRSQGIGIKESYQRFRPQDMPVISSRLDVAREEDLGKSKAVFEEHKAGLRTRLETAVGKIHDIEPAADPHTAPSVSRNALITGITDDLMTGIHERSPLSQAKLAGYLKAGEGRDKPPRGNKYWEKQAKDIHKQYHYHEEATKTADLRKTPLTDPTAVREKSILANDPDILSKLHESKLYKPPPPRPPGTKRIRALGAGLGIGAGLGVGGYMVYRGLKKRQEQPAEQKMSDRSRLIMFAKFRKKPIGLFGKGKPLTPKDIDKSVEQSKKVWAGGGLTMPEAALPSKVSGFPTTSGAGDPFEPRPSGGSGSQKPHPLQRYVGETTQEIRDRELYPQQRAAYWKKLYGKVDPIDLQKAKARHKRKIEGRSTLRRAAEEAAVTQSMGRYSDKPDLPVTVRPKGVPVKKEGKTVFWTPTPESERLLKPTYPLEGLTAEDVGQVRGSTIRREAPPKSPRGSPLEPLSVKEQINAGPSFEDVLKQAKAKAILEANEQLLNTGRSEGYTHGHGRGFTEGEAKGTEAERRRQEAFREPIGRAYEERIKSTYEKGRKQLDQSRRSKVKQIAAGIGGGAVAGGAAAWALKPGRKREREFSARLREIRLDSRNGLLYRIEHPDPEGTRAHDIATGALEGGLVGPFTEPIFAKLQGKKPQGIFKGGWKGFGKRALIGAGLGAVTTGLVGYGVNAIARAKKAREEAQANAMSRKGKVIQFAGRFPVTADFNFAPQDRQRGTGSPIRVVRDRYDKEIINRERNRRDANYARTALVGGVLGTQFRNKMKVPVGRAALIGAGAGFTAQALTRNLVTKYQKDPYGERTVTAKRIDLAPWVGGAAVAGGVAAGRVWRKSPSLRKITRKYFSSTGKEIRFAAPSDQLNEQDRKQLDKWIYGRRRKTYPIAKDWTTYGRRAGGFVTSAREVAAGEPSLDARGRPKKKEWEKGWFKTAAITTGVATAITAGAFGLKSLSRAPKGSGRWKLAQAWGRRDINKIAKKIVPGYAPARKFLKGVREEIGHKLDKPAGKLGETIEEVSGHKTVPGETSAADLKKIKDREEGRFSSRLKPIQFAEEVYDWRTSDPRGKSVRVFAPGHQKRDRSELPFYKKKGTIEAGLGVAVATLPLAVWGGHKWGGKSGGKTVLKALRPKGKSIESVPAETDTYLLRKSAERKSRLASDTESARISQLHQKHANEPSWVHGFIDKYGRHPSKPEDLGSLPKFSAKSKVILFDDPDKLKQSAAITGGSALTGAVVGSQYIGGHKLKSGENITGKRLVRRHNLFPVAYHEGIGIGRRDVAEVQYRHLKPGIGKVGATTTDRFGHGKTVYVIDKHTNVPAATKARSMIGQPYKYNIFTNNCSDFTDLCRGKSRVFSRQWQRTAGGAAIGLAGGLAASYAVKKYQESKEKKMSARGRPIEFFAGQRAIPIIRKVKPALMSSNPLAMDKYKAAAMKQYMRNPEERRKLREELYRIIKQNRRVTFAVKDDRNQIITKRNVAIGGGLAAAGLGATTLRGAIPFMRIATRNWASQGKGLIRGQNAAGHFVSDYMEGARKGLSGIPGSGAFFRSAQKNPKGIAGRLISNKLVDPEGIGPAFASSHMLKFRKGGVEALNHWDYEVTEGWKHQHKLGQMSEKKLKGRLDDQYYGREKALNAIDHLMKHAGINEHQAIHQVATKGIALHPTGQLIQNDKQVQQFFLRLATHKAGAAAGYAKKGLLSPALIAGGGTTAATAAYVGEKKEPKRGSSR